MLFRSRRAGPGAILMIMSVRPAFDRGGGPPRCPGRPFRARTVLHRRASVTAASPTRPHPGRVCLHRSHQDRPPSEVPDGHVPPAGTGRAAGERPSFNGTSPAPATPLRPSGGAHLPSPGPVGRGSAPLAAQARIPLITNISMAVRAPKGLRAGVAGTNAPALRAACQTRLVSMAPLPRGRPGGKERADARRRHTGTR